MQTHPQLRIRPRAIVAARAIATASLAIAALAAGCQPAPSAAPTGGASPAPSAAATAGSASSVPATGGVAGTPIPSLVTLELRTDGPILRAADGPADSLYALPAAGARDRDGTLVLAVVWFPSGNAAPKITISRSTDGATWQVGTTDILAGLDIGDPDPGPIPSALVQLDDGTWQLYGWAAADSSGSSFLAWRTSAPDLDGPWTVDATEMLAAGPGGSWDSLMAAAASVQRSNGEYLLWYEGEPPGSTNRGDIGLATSADGLAWTKFDDPATTDAPFAESDPVIATGICGPGTSVAVEQPQVERLGDRYVAVFGGYGAGQESMGVWAAVSADGRSWQCATPEQLLTGTDIAGGEGIHTLASVPLADGRIGVILESLGSGSSELWWATVALATD